MSDRAAPPASARTETPGGTSSGRLAVVVTGADGKIGSALADRLAGRYEVIGMGHGEGPPLIDCDLTDAEATRAAAAEIARRSGGRVASVVHLAGYYDFTGEDAEAYHAINEEGTRNLLRALDGAGLEVGQFLYAGTMLVHEAGAPGEAIDEDTPEAPGWAYPQSKARTEAIIRDESGPVPAVLLHLAGLYDDETAVPTLAHQMARIYERTFKSHVYSGDTDAGQSFIHIDDMLDAFVAAIEARERIDDGTVILVGEPEAMSYDALQERLGELIHGEEGWRTLVVPGPVAKLGAVAEVGAEPVVPDAYDQGEAPFIRPFMIDMASDNYALDISRARKLLGWEPRHTIREGLKVLVAALKRDPAGFYAANKMTPPVWLDSADERVDDVEALRIEAERVYRAEHRKVLWAHWAIAGMGLFLLASPPMIGIESGWLSWAYVALGLGLVASGLMSCSWRLPQARWVSAALGVLVMFAPLVFHPTVGTAWLLGTVYGVAVPGLAIATPPGIGISPAARVTGPTIPKGWDYSPSDWFQRLPVVILAMVGLWFSYWLCAYQLGAIDGVWDPFFPASAGRDPSLNGTEDIVTSAVSRAFPVPDAGVGALTYALEIVVGLVGTARRWRTMPWLVVLFGLMIVPLGIVSIGFIIIQPIVIGTYSTLALIGACAMVLQIPFSIDEMVATGQFLVRRHRAGRPWLRVFFTGDTDEGPDDLRDDDFGRGPGAILRDMVTGGMTFPAGLLAICGLGVGLMLSPLWLGGWAEGGLAPHVHVVGALAIVVAVTAFSPAARLVRFLVWPLAAWLAFAPFLTEATWAGAIFCWAVALAMAVAAVPRGPVRSSYGSWDRFVR